MTTDAALDLMVSAPPGRPGAYSDSTLSIPTARSCRHGSQAPTST
jgi:hypothetical protein